MIAGGGAGGVAELGNTRLGLDFFLLLTLESELMVRCESRKPPFGD